MFISLRSAHGNHAYLVFSLGMYDNDHLASQETKSYPAFFALILAIIFEREGWAIEDLLGIGEIQASLL